MLTTTLDSRLTLADTGLSKQQLLTDYRICFRSRQASLLGRREVLTGKAKFGIFGDGKELPQVAMAHSWQHGDIRSGYYRDQTLMFALGVSNVRQFFAQLYADVDLAHEPASAGRQMNGHFATRMLNEDGTWKNLTEGYHSAADCSPTASQMPRMAGLALASKLYRNLPELAGFTSFSRKGQEVVFGTIGDASTSEGLFWETINAVGVLQVPLVMSVWDDSYGISVPIRYQTTKENISEVLAGFQATDSKPGYDIHVVRAWDYPALVTAYAKAVAKTRKDHTPSLIHVIEVTQPQGHSTSGSHERYKSKERLEWEREYDCIAQFRKQLIEEGVITAPELDKLELEEKKLVTAEKAAAWEQYHTPIKQEIMTLGVVLERLASEHGSQQQELLAIHAELMALKEPFRRDLHVAARRALVLTVGKDSPARQSILMWKKKADEAGHDYYRSHLYCESSSSALKVPEVKPVFTAQSPVVDGREVLQANFDALFARYPNVVAFGEDVGFLGDVNQAFAGLQAKYGEARVSDTGIREATIMGQGIGLAMRGIRPIAEIQYLDYLLYGIQILSDDLATLRYRTKAGQMAPLIVRTRGHRLEGIWHSGSPMGMIINALKGMYVCVPRDMTRAAGMYNTLLQSDDPALIIEVLNGYRLKETLPANIGEFTVPLGMPEILREGKDITVVTYGPNCRLALEAAEALAPLNIELEIVDVQTLIPFDLTGRIVESLKKTNRIIFFDEDVQGGATAFMLQQVLEKWQGYRWLDSAPVTLTAQDNRPAYASDGDYFCKPRVEDLIDIASRIMAEADPAIYQPVFC